MYKLRTISACLCLISTLFLSACGILDVGLNDSAEPNVSVEQSAVAKTDSKNETADQIAALEPNAGTSLAAPTPPRSLKTEKLFNYPVYDEDKRFTRLEGNVQSLRDEMNKILPVISSQLALQGDVKGLVTKLNNMVSTDPVPRVSAIERAPLLKEKSYAKTESHGSRASQILQNLNKTDPPASASLKPAQDNKASGGNKAASLLKQVTAKKQAASSGKATLVDVRASDHAGKTRIVLETDNKMDFDASLGGDGKTLIISSSSGSFAEKLKNLTLGSANVAGGAILGGDSNQGYRVQLDLKQSVQIDKKLVMSPNSTTPHYRTAIDLVF